MANTEIVQAEFAQGQLDKDDVPIEQICVLSERERDRDRDRDRETERQRDRERERERERDRDRDRERENTKYIELLLNKHVCQFMHTRTHTYPVVVYLPGTTPTINTNN